MNKKQFDDDFRKDQLPELVGDSKYPDKPQISMAYTSLMDLYHRAGHITVHQYNTWTMPPDIKNGILLANHNPKLQEIRNLRARLNELYKELEVAVASEGCTHMIEQIEWVKTHCRDYYVLVEIAKGEVVHGGTLDNVCNHCRKRGITKVFVNEKLQHNGEVGS